MTRGSAAATRGAIREQRALPDTMKAAVFSGPGRLELRERPVPRPGPLDALVRVTLTSICRTDVRILRGEHAAGHGLVLGHEPVGVIAALGEAVRDYHVGERVVAGAITPCGQCEACLMGQGSQCGGRPSGGWRLGHTMDGCQAEYVLVPDARANLARIPETLTDEQVLLCPDVLSAGIAGAEQGGVRLGDTVAVFAQGPVGLCATAGARLLGAARVFVVDALENRLAMARRLGADETINCTAADPVVVIRDLTDGRGVDVAIEALGAPETFDGALRALRPGGTLSTLGVYSGKVTLPTDGFAAGLGDHRVVATLCPGGKERMRRLLQMVAAGRLDLRPLITHRFRLEEIEAAYDLFAHQRDGVLKVAIAP